RHVRAGAAGLPAVHQAGGLPRPDGAPGAGLGAPRGDRALAAARSAQAHARAAAGSARERAAGRRRSAPAGRIAGRTKTRLRTKGSIVMTAVETVERANMVNRPAIKPGDTVRVHVKVREGDKERIQVFEGMVIGMHRGGARATFTVRKVSFGQG